MAYRRLVNVMNNLAAAGDLTGIREDKGGNPVNLGLAPPDEAGAFVDQGTVVSVDRTSGATVQLRNVVVQCDQVTDEPFEAGQAVYVSRTVDGAYVIHGSVKS